MGMVVHVNGRICGDDAAVSVLDHGFLYGDGIYEVLRTYDGRPFLFERHLARLRQSARAIALELGRLEEDLPGRVRETLDAFFRLSAHEAATAADAYLRIVVTRGTGEIGYDPALCPEPTVVIIAKPLRLPAASVYERGVKIALVSVVRNHPDSIPLVKSNNLLNPVLAAQEALRRGAFDAVMRNAHGEITECSIANLFIVKDGRLITPPADSGLLPGITRDVVLDLCGPLGVPAEERRLHDADLLEADECFRTNSTQALVPVVEADGRPIGNGRPGPITRRLTEAYECEVEAAIHGRGRRARAAASRRSQLAVGA